MTSKMDAGPVIATHEVLIRPDDNFKALADRMGSTGGPWFADTLYRFLKGEIVPYEQNADFASYAPVISEEFRHIHWDDATHVHNRVRALSPYNYAKSRINDFEVKIVKTKVLEVNSPGVSGELVDAKRLIIQCARGLIEIEQLIPPNSKLMTGSEFLTGLTNKKKKSS